METNIKEGDPPERKPNNEIESDEPLPIITRWQHDFLAPLGEAAWALLSAICFVVVALFICALIVTGQAGSAIIFAVLFSVVVVAIRCSYDL